LFLARDRAVLFVVATFLVGALVALVQSGPAAGTVAALVWCVLALAVMKDWRSGALAAVAIAAVAFAKGVAAWQGSPVLLDGRIEMPFALYARMCLAFLLVTALVVLMMREVSRGLLEALADLDMRTAGELAQRKGREAAERQLSRAQRMELVGRLASGIAHDVNNALTVIMASADLLRLPNMAARRDELAQDILSAARTAGQTVATITAFSRTRVAVPSVVRASEAVGAFARTAERVLPRAVRVETQCESDAIIRIDRAGLDQALLNLAVNARDAMPEGGMLSLRVKSPDDRRVVIEVNDTGTGMDEETLSHLFEPFFTTKEEGRGTGLGLAMVRRTIDMAGGTVEVQSQPGIGTTFRIFLPTAEQLVSAPGP
ncbi:MAG TPA: ATP-binding protein, partial [Polyangiaceae bacterium]|nr:ATP-binding protein [Polyangiaceae bacterium]